MDCEGIDKPLACPENTVMDPQLDQLKFDANGLIPAIVQDHQTGQVLMMAWMNADSLRQSLETGRTWFWSRSRKKYWMKGESSGHVQEVREVRYDCDADCLLVRVDQHGAACHTGERTCFYRVLSSAPAAPAATDVVEGSEAS